MAHKRKAKKNIRCIVYLATVADENTVDRKEQKQLRYIREYAKAHQLQIVKVFHRSILGQMDMNRHYQNIVRRIQSGEAEAILLANMTLGDHSHICQQSLPDAYGKVGQMLEAGGRVITVDEGELKLNLAPIGGLAV